ncbi:MULTISPECIES: TrmB family transcriptional regulator [Bordetella]|uniref:Transcriptional regulator n=5 Tax=Bordetella TaxID=517 RepID=Q7VZI3_BORPE|nr:MULTISPECIES: TrmB family transcriptional regulator [Bordetella]KCV20676.1 sugar-specific transcriptional regulator, TrmB family [Bordetella pertussis B200]KCV32630.1 sugar-specific transcriptional regulator, TrmB family [Bordetella bronchiseptica 00-P-2730]KDD64583.1 sugar-specific transcriptional regulator, TrmB family [Bordetella bronchiseptica OSU553]AEE66345.1 putative transcriptional regulator [Bordetella pertussis CS]AJB25651.1 transcriptional regulator [Bordetella pertussis 137]
MNNTRSAYEKIIKDLQGVGFSDYEAKTYIALLLTPNATAYEISKEAGIPKANCYSVLEALRKNGAVQAVSENPVKYVAVDPNRYFNQMVELTQLRCEDLKESLKNIGHLPQEDLVWSLNDAAAVGLHIEKMIGSARDTIRIKAADTTLEPHLPSLKKAARRGVKVLIILFGEDVRPFELGKNCKVYLHEGNGIRVGISHKLITVTRDYKEALVAEVGRDAYGSYTENKPIVTLADSLLRHEIYFAEIFSCFGDEIQEKFGPALVKLRESYLPADQADALKVFLETADPARLAGKATAA